MDFRKRLAASVISACNPNFGAYKSLDSKPNSVKFLCGFSSSLEIIVSPGDRSQANARYKTCPSLLVDLSKLYSALNDSGFDTRGECHLSLPAHNVSQVNIRAQVGRIRVEITDKYREFEVRTKVKYPGKETFTVNKKHYYKFSNPCNVISVIDDIKEMNDTIEEAEASGVVPQNFTKVEDLAKVDSLQGIIIPARGEKALYLNSVMIQNVIGVDEEGNIGDVADPKYRAWFLTELKFDSGYIARIATDGNEWIPFITTSRRRRRRTRQSRQEILRPDVAFSTISILTQLDQIIIREAIKRYLKSIQDPEE